MYWFSTPIGWKSIQLNENLLQIPFLSNTSQSSSVLLLIFFNVGIRASTEQYPAWRLVCDGGTAGVGGRRRMDGGRHWRRLGDQVRPMVYCGKDEAWSLCVLLHMTRLLTDVAIFCLHVFLWNWRKIFSPMTISILIFNLVFSVKRPCLNYYLYLESLFVI